MTKQILIVDDEERVLFVLRNILNKLRDSCQVTTAHGGEAALDVAREMSFDLVITDLIMQNTDGVQLTEALQELMPDVAVIWMTAYGCRQFRKDFERLEVYRCVDKPLEIHEVRQLVRKALEDLERRQEQPV
jgi:DNA-binding NtrC family response regulator